MVSSLLLQFQSRNRGSFGFKLSDDALEALVADLKGFNLVIEVLLVSSNS